MTFTVQSEDCILHCKKTGTGPLMLMIHGVGCDGDYFTAAAQELKNDFTVVSYDRRGHSQSVTCDDADFSVDCQARDAAAIIQTLDMGAAVVVGCSAGGLIGYHLAKNYSKYVDKLFLYEPPLGWGEEFKERLKLWHEELHAAADANRINRALLIFIKAIGGVDRTAKSRDMESHGRDVENLKTFLYREMDGMLEYKTDDCLRLKVPCILTAGNMDEDGLFSKYAENTAERIGASFARIDGYHNAAADKPKEFADRVKKLVSEI